DNRDNIKPGFKFNDYELKGVPLRIAIGPKDLEKGQVELARRDTLEKSFVPQSELVEMIPALLEKIQNSLYDKAFSFRDEHITAVDSYEEFKTVLEEKGGFISAHWDGTEASEEAIKKETKATIRCIPYDAKEEAGKCIYSGASSSQRVLFAKAY
ncbi:MAG: His/Gly/Thr/Pro-type tRNA ligase C-terminal domain-containing protein, partial [Candidatus Arcticimaribacter sp.]